MSIHDETNKRFGLARVLSKMGLASRSQASELIKAGLVRVNGKLVRDVEFPVRMDIDKVSVNQQLAIAQQRMVIMLNKPRGVVTTRIDEQQRATVYDCLPESLPWLAPVGRLDKASEGLLLMCNDPEWAAAITDPSTQLEKTYHVQIGGLIDEPRLAALRSGIESDIGFLKVLAVDVLRRGEKNTWLSFTLDEGKNRHIRRMLEAFNLPVLRLIRVAIGPLHLGDLAKGQWRQLSDIEIDKLMDGSES